jgi:Polysaccharide lyase
VFVRSLNMQRKVNELSAAAYVGRVGGLAVALGLGAAVLAGQGVASAAPDESKSASHGPAASSDDSSSGSPSRKSSASPSTPKSSGLSESDSTPSSTSNSARRASHAGTERAVVRDDTHTRSADDPSGATTTHGRTPQTTAVEDSTTTSSAVGDEAVTAPVSRAQKDSTRTSPESKENRQDSVSPTFSEHSALSSPHQSQTLNSVTGLGTTTRAGDVVAFDRRFDGRPHRTSALSADENVTPASETTWTRRDTQVPNSQVIAPPVAADIARAVPTMSPQRVNDVFTANWPVAPVKPSVKWDELLALVRRDFEQIFAMFDKKPSGSDVPRSEAPSEPATLPEPSPLPEVDVPTVPAVPAPVAPANPAPVAPAAPVPTAPALFVGDYGTGDFSQWSVMQNKSRNASPSGWSASGNYSAQIVEDPERGFVARYEVRQGDRASFDPSTVNRSEVQSSGITSGGGEGDLRSFSFSVKFDPTFSEDTGGWGVLTNQWHANASTGAPPVAFYANGDKWQLIANRQSSPGAYLGSQVLWETPVAPGNWHDIQMVVNFSTSDSAGYVQVWHNGVPQTLMNGSDNYHIRTLIPGYANPTTYYKEGIYRYASSSTAIVYQTGFRSAAAQTGV